MQNAKNTQSAAPAIDCRNPLNLSRRCRRAKKQDLATNATDLIPDLANVNFDLSPSTECVAAPIAEQEAQAIDLQAIGDILCVLAREQTA